MRTSRILIAFSSIALLIAWSKVQGRESIPLDEIVSSGKTVTVTQKSAYIQGRWRRVAGTSVIRKPSVINTVQVTCDRQSMLCIEIIAELVTPKDFTMLDVPLLTIEQTNYKVIDWSEDSIYAIASEPVAIFELSIRSKDQHAERGWRETKSYGSKTADPSNFDRWILD